MANSPIPRTVKNLLASAQNPHNALSTLRPKLQANQYRALLQYLPSVSRRATQSVRIVRGKFSSLSTRGFVSVLGAPFPKTYSDLVRTQNTLSPLPIENELLWTAERIGLYGRQLSQFVSHKLAIEAAILSGDGAEALNLLDSFENDHGKSFFLIETRLAVLQNFKGLEAQKRYLQNIRNTWNKGITPFVAYHVSQKLEFATNPLAFPERFVSVLNRSEIQHGLFEYLLYRVLRLVPNHDLWPILLTWEQNSALIDQYETLLTVLQNYSKSPEIIARSLSVLKSNVDDSRLYGLSVLTEETPLTNGIPVTEILIRQKLDSNRPEEALMILAEDTKLASLPHTIPLEAICKADLSAAPEPRNYPIGSRDYIVDNLVRVIRKDTNGYEDSLLDLLRFADAFASFSMSKITKLEVLRAASDLVFDIGEDLVASFVADSALSPEYLTILPGEARQSIIEKAARDEIVLTPALGRSATAAARVRNENQRTELNHLLDERDIERALDRIASAYLDNPQIFRMLPVRRAVRAISDDHAPSIKPMLALAIVYDLYLRFIGDDRAYIRNDAYEDFLGSQGCERPSQLVLPIRGEDPKRVIYFLRHICIPEVMHDSDAFRSSKDLLEERLKVLTLLRANDAENVAQYDTEIRDITRFQIVQQGLLHVERSKFAINTQPIRKWAEKNLKESYQRTRDLAVTLQPDVSNLPPDDEGVLKTPVDELADLNHESLSQFIEEAYTNSFYGLDSYLSMRARHGSFSGHIRAVLEEERIITSRDARTEEYKANELWLHRLSLDPWHAEPLDELLKSFSRRFDQVVQKFSDERLQVKTHEKPHGLFQYVITSLHAVLLATAAQPPNAFDRYVDQCLAVFWENVELSTQGVRAAIETALKPDLEKIVRELIISLEKMRSTHVETGDLINAVRRAQTNLHSSLDALKDWFYVPEVLPDRVYSMDEVIDIGLNQVKKLHPDFDPRVERDVTYNLGIVELPRFSDIFFIIFENIQRHAGIGHRPFVRIQAAHEEGRFSLLVENEMQAWEGIEERLEKSRSIIAAGQFQRVVSSEGGTGLVKLWNTLSTDRATLHFMTADDRFVVKLSIPVIELDGGHNEFAYPIG